MISSEDERDAEQQPDQTSRRESLVEMLLRPLGNDFEMRHVFAGDLEERLSHSIARPERGELTAEGAAAWLGKTQDDEEGGGDGVGKAVGSRRPVWLRPLAVLATVLTFVTLALEFYHDLPLAVTFWKSPPLLWEMGERQLYKMPLKREDPRLGPALPLAAEQNCRAHPEDSVRYCYYVMILRAYDQPLPNDYVQTWRRLEPDNAFWPLFQATVELQDHYRISPSSSPAVVREAVRKLLGEAASLPRCQSRFDEALRFADGLKQPTRTYVQASVNREWSSGRKLSWIPHGFWSEVHGEIFGIVNSDASRIEGPPADLLALEHKLKEWVEANVKEDPNQMSFPDQMLVFNLLGRAGHIMGMRGVVILVAGLFLTLAALSGFRQHPLASRSARMTQCTWPLLRPAGLALPVWWGVVIPAGLLGMVAFLLASTHPWSGAQYDLAMVFSPAVLVLPVLALTVEIARREVSRGVAFLGLRSAGFSRALGWLMIALSLVPLVILIVAGADGSPSRARERFLLTTAGCSGGLVVLWLAGKFLLGYASPAANVRHRLIALRLIPVLLLSAIALDVLALALHPVERYLVALAVQKGLSFY
jgi:hypothetical protein